MKSAAGFLTVVLENDRFGLRGLPELQAGPSTCNHRGLPRKLWRSSTPTLICGCLHGAELPICEPYSAANH
jgi:hypothetical protein